MKTWARLERGDRISLMVLFFGPILFLALPAAAGYPLMTGDDIIQNFPLRALAGEMLRHGTLPTYDAFSWSGVPLLGAINTGALFPAIAAFVLLPPLVAFVTTEALMFGLAAIGLYYFLRNSALRPFSAALGAVTYGIGGYLSSQAVHLDVVEVGASLAWALVAEERIAHAPVRHRGAWTALCGVSIGCIGLSGSPEACFYAAVGAAIFAVHLLCERDVSYKDKRIVAPCLVAAGLIGVLIASIQILPGADFVAISQRSSSGYSYLAGGSLAPVSFLVLLAPHLLGGGPLGLKDYVGTYNLAETDAYAGILALVATFGLAFSWKTKRAANWRVFYLIGGLGILVALGSHTPFLRLIDHVPVIDASRLPSRALILYALSAAVLLAHWVDEIVYENGPLRSRGRFCAECCAPLCAVVLIIVVTIGAAPVARAIAQQPIGPWTVARIAPYLALTATLGIAALIFVILRERLSVKARSIALFSIFIVDLLGFLANQSSFAPIYASALGAPNQLERALSARIGPTGRFLLVDPTLAGGIALDDLGTPNLNVFFSAESAQGYGSLTWAPYAKATGTHGQDVVDARALDGTVFDDLNVRALLAGPASFDVPVSGTDAPVALSSSTETTRYFGAEIAVRSITIFTTNVQKGRLHALVALARGLRLVSTGSSRPLLSNTHTQHATESTRLSDGRDAITVTFAHPESAGGLELGSGAQDLRAVSIIVEPQRGRAFSPTGPLAASVTPPHFVANGTIGPYAVFINTRAKGAFFVATNPPAPSHHDVHIVVSAVKGPSWSPTESLSVSASAPVHLIRSVTNLPGWHVSIATASRTYSVPVRSFGLVQSVAIPSGQSRLTFTYVAPGLRLGELLSTTGWIFVVVLCALTIWRTRRRRDVNVES
jgi:hypothetical protein